MLNVNLPCMRKLSLQSMAGMKCQWQSSATPVMPRIPKSELPLELTFHCRHVFRVSIKSNVNKEGVDMAIPKFSMKLHRRTSVLMYKHYKETTVTQHALFSNLISKYLNILCNVFCSMCHFRKETHLSGHKNIHCAMQVTLMFWKDAAEKEIKF